MSEQKTNRVAKLVLGAFILLAAGVLYAWSILNKPLETCGVAAPDLQFAFTVALCSFCIGGLISGLLAKKLSICVRMLIAAVLSCAGFCLVSTYQSSPAVIVLGYGVLAGAGIGIVYNVVIAATGAWFPDKKGICTGVLMMAFGFSGLVIGKAATSMFAISEDSWRMTYRALGLLLLVIFGVSAFLLKQPETAKKPLGTDEDLDTKQMLKQISFWKLFLFFILLAAVGSTAIGFGRRYFEAVGLTTETAVTVAGLLSIFNGLGRIVSGTLFDKCGLRKTMLLTSAVAVTAPLLALVASATTSGWLGIVGLFLCAFSYGFSPTMSAAAVSAFYGSRYFALNFSVLNLVLIPASFMSTLAGSLVESSGGYVSTFVVLVAASAVGLLINLTLFVKKK